MSLNESDGGSQKSMSPSNLKLAKDALNSPQMLNILRVLFEPEIGCYTSPIDDYISRTKEMGRNKKFGDTPPNYVIGIVLTILFNLEKNWNFKNLKNDKSVDNIYDLYDLRLFDEITSILKSHNLGRPDYFYPYTSINGPKTWLAGWTSAKYTEINGRQDLILNFTLIQKFLESLQAARKIDPTLKIEFGTRSVGKQKKHEQDYYDALQDLRNGQ